MPRRSKVLTLPADVKAWIDGALIEGNFSGYEMLAAELKAKGYDISKSGLHRYGANFDERLRALKLVTEQARAVVQASPDEENAVTEALVRLTQEKLFGVMMELHVDPETVDLTKITRSIADLARSSVGQKKYAAEVRAEVLRTATKEAEKVVAEAGVTDDQWALIRAKFLGVEVNSGG